MTYAPNIFDVTNTVPVNQLTAMQVGVERAAVLGVVEFLVETDTGHAKDYEGNTYVAVTRTEWMRLMPYWSLDKMNQLLHELEDAGMLLTRKEPLNDDPRDQTLWFALNAEHRVFHPATIEPDPLFPDVKRGE